MTVAPGQTRRSAHSAGAGRRKYHLRFRRDLGKLRPNLNSGHNAGIVYLETKAEQSCGEGLINLLNVRPDGGKTLFLGPRVNGKPVRDRIGIERGRTEGAARRMASATEAEDRTQ